MRLLFTDSLKCQCSAVLNVAWLMRLDTEMRWRRMCGRRIIN